MALSEDEVLHLLKMFEESSFGELRLETGELKLLVRKKGYAASCAEGDLPPVAARVPRPQQAREVAPPAREGSSRREEPSAEAGSVFIKAPMLGVAYRRPNPETPAYVEVGSFVKVDDTVCLIEVMKVFTAVKAGVEGYITEILFENNEMVEYGQPLFRVRQGSEQEMRWTG